MVKQQYLLHMSRQYGGLRHRLAAEIGSGVWGTPANFNGFCVLASLLQRRRSPEANQSYQTLHDVWPSSGLVTKYAFGGSCLLAELRHVQNSLCVQVLRSPNCSHTGTGSVTARHSSSERQPNCGVQQRMPPIFSRAAITLRIGPHSSYIS